MADRSNGPNWAAKSICCSLVSRWSLKTTTEYLSNAFCTASLEVESSGSLRSNPLHSQPNISVKGVKSKDIFLTFPAMRVIFLARMKRSYGTNENEVSDQSSLRHPFLTFFACTGGRGFWTTRSVWE